MPGRNIYKIYLEDTYYHVYNRGVNKQDIFKDEQDYTVFLSLIRRYLDSKSNERQKNRQPYPCYAEQVNLLAYCLMPNHFHLFLYQISEDGMTLLLKSVSTAYGMYFNKKYRRVGPVFQQRYRAVRIDGDTQLMHITRYIHLNPRNYTDYIYSSYRYYRGDAYARWLNTGRVMGLFDYSMQKYVTFVDDYKDRRDELELLKDELAG